MRYPKPLPYWRQFCGNTRLDTKAAPEYKDPANRPIRLKAAASTGGFKLTKHK